MAAADGSGHGARAGWLRRRVFGPRLAAVLADDWWLPELGASLDSSNFIVPSKVGWIHHECLGASSNSRVVWCHSFLFLFNAFPLSQSRILDAPPTITENLYDTTHATTRHLHSGPESITDMMAY